MAECPGISERDLVKGIFATYQRYMTTFENLCSKYDREFQEDEDGGEVLSEEDLVNSFSDNEDTLNDNEDTFNDNEDTDDEDDIQLPPGYIPVLEDVTINEELIAHGIDILRKVKEEINWDEIERRAAERDKENGVTDTDSNEEEEEVER